MKKFLLLSLMLGAILSIAHAQTAGYPPSMLQQVKEKQKPGMIEKAGLTDAQAEKLFSAQF